ncbi:MAG: radical SAM family heme chaperone HemW [Flavobacteriaceae bacterium]|nr:radical SAM family heme chaperone HemW [Flavobacteriaceae bacterium]
MSGIYIHIPFCKQKCHYCDFHFSTSLKRKDEMMQALVKELVLRKEELKDETIETIYVGGGTPSLLRVEELQLLINTIFQNYKVAETPEITLEANPDDLLSSRAQSRDIFKDYRLIGINRLSIGIQSFFDEDLQLMNRAHNAEEAKKSLLEATHYFDNITIDLIYGIPNMSNKRWKENLKTAFESGVNHISSYALTVEPKTALASFIKQGKYPQVSEELALEHFNTLVEETEKEGFVQYEISNFGKPGFFSKHNTSYWQGKKYLGIGSSAHSFDGKQRSWNISNNVKYIKSIAENNLPQQIEILSEKDLFNEMIMTGLRTIWGVPLHRIETQFGKSVKDELLKNAHKFIAQKLLVISNESDKSQSLKVTQKGKFLSDGIASDLFII